MALYASSKPVARSICWRKRLPCCRTVLNCLAFQKIRTQEAAEDTASTSRTSLVGRLPPNTMSHALVGPLT